MITNFKSREWATLNVLPTDVYFSSSIQAPVTANNVRQQGGPILTTEDLRNPASARLKFGHIDTIPSNCVIDSMGIYMEAAATTIIFGPKQFTIEDSISGDSDTTSFSQNITGSYNPIIGSFSKSNLSIWNPANFSNLKFGLEIQGSLSGGFAINAFIDYVVLIVKYSYRVRG